MLRSVEGFHIIEPSIALNHGIGLLLGLTAEETVVAKLAPKGCGTVAGSCAV